MNYTKDMKEKVNRIKSIIADGFDRRSEIALFSYIMNKGTENLIEPTDEQIEEELKEDVGIFGREYLVAMVKTAAKLSKEFSIVDLMTYIRMELYMIPDINDVVAYRTRHDVYELYLDDCESDSVLLHIVEEE